MRKKEKNEIYIINQVRDGCFKAQKVIDEENGPEQEAPQPDEAPPRGIWFKISHLCSIWKHQFQKFDIHS